MGMEVITTTNKEQRDRMFDDLRKNGNRLERQAVKFSGNEPVLASDGLPKTLFVYYKPNGRLQHRMIYRSNWSVAYPDGRSN